MFCVQISSINYIIYLMQQLWKRNGSPIDETFLRNHKNTLSSNLNSEYETRKVSKHVFVVQCGLLWKYWMHNIKWSSRCFCAELETVRILFEKFQAPVLPPMSVLLKAEKLAVTVPRVSESAAASQRPATPPQAITGHISSTPPLAPSPLSAASSYPPSMIIFAKSEWILRLWHCKILIIMETVKLSMSR